MVALGQETGVHVISATNIELSFPNLIIDGYAITSPATPDYNCIAWAAEDNQAWWWPDQQLCYYWPTEIPRKEALEFFIMAYKTLGYSVCEDPAYENNFEKIAIFANSAGKPTHAARQLHSGKWTSKLGSSEDIEHALDGVSGSEYGSVAVIMKRPK
jgi:hypothetical protein